MRDWPTDPIRLPDAHYWELHRKCAEGTLDPVERIELDALCAIKEAEWGVPASPSGSCPSGGAAKASPAKPSILNAISTKETRAAQKAAGDNQ